MPNILDIAKYTSLRLLQKGHLLSPLKLQKILYYLQAWSLVYFNGKPLFENQPEAWANGPVYREIYEAYQALDFHSQMNFIDMGVTEEDVPMVLANLHSAMYLSDERLTFIEEVLIYYGSRPQEQLTLLTLSQAPWSEARRGESPISYSGQKISLKSMYDYYSKALIR